MALANDVAWMGVRELGTRLRGGEFTAVDLARFFLDRIEQKAKPLNAVVTVAAERALAEARQADEDLAAGRDRGPLHGIPYGAKDLLSTRGIATTWGAACFKEQVIDEDATVIRRLREAGAVLAAKLSMVELAGGLGYDQANASFTGPGLNPFDSKAWSGGSSSGPGSAVGAGAVPFAIGSETSGSIMTPAGYCGITGLRPTYGRVSRHGAMALSWSMDKLGPLARTADDCGLVLAAIAGHDPLDLSSSERAYAYTLDEQPPFRLATLKGITDHVQPEVKANYQRSLEVLRPFATFSEVELPDLPYGLVASTIIACEMAAAFEGLLADGGVWQMTAPEDRLGLHAALLIPAKDYINAQRIRVKIQQALDALVAPYDALVAPTLASVAGPIDKSFSEYQRGLSTRELTPAGNVAGLPALTMPNGFGDRGLPTGLKLIGRAFEENRLLAIARKYQQLTDWHRRRPI